MKNDELYEKCRLLENHMDDIGLKAKDKLIILDTIKGKVNATITAEMTIATMAKLLNGDFPPK